MSQNSSSELSKSGFQLAYSFTPRSYRYNVIVDGKVLPYPERGDAEHILGLVGENMDARVYNEVKIVRITEAFPDDKLDEGVQNRYLVYTKPWA